MTASGTDAQANAPDGGVPDGVIGGERAWLHAHGRAVALTWLACAVVALAISIGAGTWLGIGDDPDDMMRFVQLRDLMEGQPWTDTSQRRLGVEGTPMHWSRLADVPYLIVAWPLSVLIGVEPALRVAGTVVPGALSGLFAVGVWRGVTHLNGGQALMGRSALAVGALTAAQMMMFQPRFGAGAFDHHHLQIGLLAVAIGYSLHPNPARSTGVIVALALVASAVTGLETLLMVVGLCGLWALAWALQPTRAEATRSFALTLAGAAAVAMLVFVAPRNWGAIACDAYGLPLAPLLIGGGLGLATLTRMSGRLQNPITRLAALAALGGLCTLAVVLGTPQCLSGPLFMLPPVVVEDWLATVGEARPLLTPTRTASDLALYIGVPVFAVGLALVMAIRPARVEYPRPYWLALAGLIALGGAMVAYQQRFYIFALVGASIVAIWAVARVLARPDGSSRAILLAGAVIGAFAPLQSALVGLIPTPAGNTSKPAQTVVRDLPSDSACYTSALHEALRAGSDSPPVVWAKLGEAGPFLYERSARPLAGNYHRGHADIARWLSLRAAAPQDGARLMAEMGVDYVLICEGGFAEAVAREDDPGGLVAALAEGREVEGLVAETVPGSSLRLYRVTE